MLTRGRRMWCTAGMGAACLLAGCTSDNRVVGHRLERQHGQYFGDFGVVGNLNEVTIERGSKLTILKVAGDANRIYVEDEVPLGKIEVWGERNEISVPEQLRVVRSVWGKGNKIILRPMPAYGASAPAAAPQPAPRLPPPPSADVSEEGAATMQPADAPTEPTP